MTEFNRPSTKGYHAGDENVPPEVRERPVVREFDNTSLEEAVQQGYIGKTPESPADLQLTPEEKAAIIERRERVARDGQTQPLEITPNKEKVSRKGLFVKLGAAATVAGLGVATWLGINSGDSEKGSSANATSDRTISAPVETAPAEPESPVTTEALTPEQLHQKELEEAYLSLADVKNGLTPIQLEAAETMQVTTEMFPNQDDAVKQVFSVTWAAGQALVFDPKTGEPTPESVAVVTKIMKQVDPAWEPAAYPGTMKLYTYLAAQRNMNNAEIASSGATTISYQQNHTVEIVVDPATLVVKSKESITDNTKKIIGNDNMDLKYEGTTDIGLDGNVYLIEKSVQQP